MEGGSLKYNVSESGENDIANNSNVNKKKEKILVIIIKSLILVKKLKKILRKKIVKWNFHKKI